MSFWYLSAVCGHLLTGRVFRILLARVGEDFWLGCRCGLEKIERGTYPTGGKTACGLALVEIGLVDLTFVVVVWTDVVLFVGAVFVGVCVVAVVFSLVD